MAVLYDSGNLYTTGVVNAGADSGDITFTVPYDAPDTLYYRCQYHSGMGSEVSIKNLTPNDLQGPTGATGTNGTNGSDGATGPTGEDGTNGTNGSDGATGPTGEDGTNGTNGSDGATGPTGAAASTVPGPTGPQGVTGEDGAGSTGPTGPSVGFTSGNTAPSVSNTGDFWYENDTGLYYANVYDGSTLAWLQVSGRPGPTGEQGPAGAGSGGSTLSAGDGLTLSQNVGRCWLYSRYRSDRNNSCRWYFC